MKKRTALITGASRGIGKAIAELFRANALEVLTPTRQELDLLSEESIKNFLEKNETFEHYIQIIFHQDLIMSQFNLILYYL